MKKNLHHNLSIYLDLLRLIAAFIVFCAHTRSFLLPGIALGPLAWSREAVAVFFVLSGFVISYVVDHKEDNWQTYLVARMARIYPVALAAIAVTFLCDNIGYPHNPAHYEALDRLHPGFFHVPTWSAVFANLSFTNQIWFRHAVFGTDEPYWSLGFEVQYYLFFFFASFFEGRRRLALMAAWALFCGPKILLYLPLWLLGGVAKDLSFRYRSMSPLAAGAVFAASIGVLLVTRFALGPYATNMYHVFPIQQEVANFFYFTLVGVAVALNIVAASSLLSRLPDVGPATSKAVRWLAGGSFTLYLVHQPLLVTASALLDHIEERRMVGALAAAGVLATCYLLAEVVERRKKTYAAFFEKAFMRMRWTANREA